MNRRIVAAFVAAALALVAFISIFMYVKNADARALNGVASKKVYVVVAQSQQNGRLNSRMFYFTEVAGRIYSVATNTGVDAADRIAEESEKVINSLQPRTRPVQQAKSLE